MRLLLFIGARTIWHATCFLFALAISALLVASPALLHYLLGYDTGFGQRITEGTPLEGSTVAAVAFSLGEPFFLIFPTVLFFVSSVFLIFIGGFLIRAYFYIRQRTWSSLDPPTLAEFTFTGSSALISLWLALSTYIMSFLSLIVSGATLCTALSRFRPTLPDYCVYQGLTMENLYDPVVWAGFLADEVLRVLLLDTAELFGFHFSEISVAPSQSETAIAIWVFRVTLTVIGLRAIAMLVRFKVQSSPL